MGASGVDCPHKDSCPFPGEKLDYKTCEALEEVFKRLQFKVVDLEQTNLDEDVSIHAPLPLEAWVGRGQGQGLLETRSRYLI